jgi:hypothetical protein
MVKLKAKVGVKVGAFVEVGATVFVGASVKVGIIGVRVAGSTFGLLVGLTGDGILGLAVGEGTLEPAQLLDSMDMSNTVNVRVQREAGFLPPYLVLDKRVMVVPPAAEANWHTTANQPSNLVMSPRLTIHQPMRRQPEPLPDRPTDWD